MKKTNVFFVKTLFHLLQVIIIINKKENNILYLDGKKIKYLKESMQGVYFKKVYVNKYNFESFKVLRHIQTVFLSFLYRLKRIIPKKKIIFFTPQHNVLGTAFAFYFLSNKIRVLEDGNYSYNEYCSGLRNFLYENQKKHSLFKWILGDYFLNIYNQNIDGFYFFNKERLKLNLTHVYTRIEEKIIEINMQKELEKMDNTKKEWINSVFLKNINLDSGSNKKLIILTQPLEKNGTITFSNQIEKYSEALQQNSTKNHKRYIKTHPSEPIGKYDKFIKKNSLTLIPKDFPFELLHICSVSFDIGITYNSTAITSNIIKHKIILDKSQKDLFKI